MFTNSICNRYWQEFNNFQFQLISHQVCCWLSTFCSFSVPLALHFIRYRWLFCLTFLVWFGCHSKMVLEHPTACWMSSIDQIYLFPLHSYCLSILYVHKSWIERLFLYNEIFNWSLETFYPNMQINMVSLQEFSRWIFCWYCPCNDNI
jgi:hypothetical protein